MKKIEQLLLEEFKKIDFCDDSEYACVLKVKEKIAKELRLVIPYSVDLKILNEYEEAVNDVYNFYYKKLIQFTMKNMMEVLKDISMY